MVWIAIIATVVFVSFDFTLMMKLGEKIFNVKSQPNGTYMKQFLFKIIFNIKMQI